MKYRSYILIPLFLLLQEVKCSAQLPDTDIFLAELSFSESGLKVSTPTNMTRRSGYDNQPCFFPDGTGFYFVGIHDDTTQSDVFKCDLKSRSISKLTRTPVSEYSPQVSPDGKMLGVVRVDTDSGQRFYTIPLDETRMSFHHEGSDSIGYYVFINDSAIAMFVLGKENSLQILDLVSGKREMICTSIGRCLKADPSHDYIYFLDKRATPIVKRFSTKDKSIESIAAPLDGVEDFDVLKDQSVLMGDSGKLYLHGRNNPEWIMIADLSASVGNFYRIAVDPENTRIAFVAYTGKKP